MSFAESLRGIAEIDPTFSTLGLPAAAHRKDDLLEYDTRRDRAQAGWTLTAPYEDLAWKYLAPIYDAVDIMKPGYLRDRHIELAHSSMAGIMVLTHYLAMLPYVYVKQRPSLPSMPQKLDEQVEELGGIASRSIGAVAAIADEKVAGDSKVEAGLFLSSVRSTHELIKYVEISVRFQLEDTPDGLVISPRWFEDGVVNRPYDPQGRVGCMALKLATGEGLSVFEDVWQGMSHYATATRQLFSADISRIQEAIAT